MRRDVALVFPGQGGQQPRMGADLYGVEPTLTAVMDEFFAEYGPDGPRLRDAWLSDRPGPDFDDCSRAQPLLFAIGAALAFAVIARGLRPTVLVGHSVGELAAAAVAGVFGIADGSRAMVARTTAMAATEPGGMLAVAAGVDRIREVLGDDLAERGIAIAAINSPRQTVLSGATAALRAVERTLKAGVVACRPVKARQAFHSPLCADAAIRFAELLRRIELRPPAITIRSTCTARDVTDAESVTPEFWSAQLAKPVLFWPAMNDLLESGNRIFLEAGPKGSCAAALHLHPTVQSHANAVLPLLPASARGEDHRVFDESVTAALSMTAAL
ncbi:acyltransferase domain-containing protein [Streptomyces sp. NPDC002671]